MTAHKMCRECKKKNNWTIAFLGKNLKYFIRKAFLHWANMRCQKPIGIHNQYVNYDYVISIPLALKNCIKTTQKTSTWCILGAELSRNITENLLVNERPCHTHGIVERITTNVVQGSLVTKKHGTI